MPPDARAYLWDIQAAAQAIERFTTGLDAHSYGGSEMIRAAVERKFEIIGEALGRLSKIDPGLAERIPDSRAIIAFRNLLIHGYAVIDSHRVFRIAQTSLPELLNAVAALLEQIDPP